MPKITSGITIGRIVHYVLDSYDVDGIYNQRRLHPEVFQGNSVWEGMEVPMIIVAVFPNEYGSEAGVNGQIILDGNDTYWVTSRKQDEDKSFGTWHWPEMARILLM